MKTKSVLDGVSVRETLSYQEAFSQAARPPLPIVSSCPKCGAPIYGQPLLTKNTPELVYSCNCRNEGKQVEGTTRTS